MSKAQLHPCGSLNRTAFAHNPARVEHDCNERLHRNVSVGVYSDFEGIASLLGTLPSLVGGNIQCTALPKQSV